MKIQAIKKLILRAKYCDILTGQQGQQWIGTDKWIVRVDDGLRLRADSVKGLFDMDTEQTEKLTITEAALEDAAIWPVMRRTQNKMDVARLGINNFGGVEVLTFSGKVYLAGIDEIKAAVDKADYREYWLGWDRDSNPLIIVMDGLMFVGVVRARNISECKALHSMMKAITELFEPDGTFERGHEPEDTEAGEQMTI